MLFRSGTTALALYTAGEFGGLSVAAERVVGKGKVILLGSMLSGENLLRLIDCAPVAQATNNVVLVERSGTQHGIIAVETENKAGRITLDGEYTDLLTGNKLTGGVEIPPYGALVLRKMGKAV